MKYEEVRRVINGKVEKIQIKELSKKEIDGSEGMLYCPSDNCEAKLCFVHNSKDGGRTSFMKAIDDDAHLPDCIYRNENHRLLLQHRSKEGYFTEEQIKNHVRAVYKDIIQKNRTLVKTKSKKRQSTISVTNDNKDEKLKTKERRSTRGVIVFGEEDTGNKGRMSRCYELKKDDIGQMRTIYGTIAKVEMYGKDEARIFFVEERLSNVEVLVGSIYISYTPYMKEHLNILKDYFEESKNSINFTGGGLITEKNGKIVLEVQAKESFLLDGRTLIKIVSDKLIKTSEGELTNKVKNKIRRWTI